jgi:hypothetical protein
MNLLQIVFLVPTVLLVVAVVIKIYLKSTTGLCRSRAQLIGKVAIVTGANTGEYFILYPVKWHIVIDRGHFLQVFDFYRNFKLLLLSE